MNYKDFNDYELINFIAEGNEDASNILLKKYEPLIKKEALKLLPYCDKSGLDINDLIQEGLIGLHHAIEKYKEQSDVMFYTYALKCIQRKMISTLVGVNRKKNKPLNESISLDDDNTLIKILKDGTPNPEEYIMNSETEKILISNIKLSLTDFECNVFDLFISGFNYIEIANILDKDIKSIDNAIQRIKKKIKNINNKDLY